MLRESKYTILLAIALFSLIETVEAQNARISLMRANKLYKRGKYQEAESLYREGSKKAEYKEARTFALGNSLYRQKKYQEAEESYRQVATDSTLSSTQRSEAYHNIGNIAMKNKKYEQAIESYKQALIQNPMDDDTRYNLVLAQKQLQKQKNENKDNNQNNEQQNQQKQQNPQQPNKDNQNKQDKQQSNNQQTSNSDNKDKQPPSEGSISKQQAEQLLDSYKSSDEETRKRVELQKAMQQKDNSKNRRQW